MSFVPLPDGSRVTTFSGVPQGAAVRDTSDKFSVLTDLRPLKNNFLTMTLLRQLVTREGDGFGTVPSGDEALLDEVARLLVTGRFRWVNVSSENGETVKGKVGSTTPVQTFAPPPAPKPLPKQGPTPPPQSTPPPPVEKIVVIPVLKVEYKVVLLDRNLNQHLAGTDPKAKVSGTAIEVSFRASKTSPKFPKGLKLKASGTGAVEAYEDADLTKKLDLSKPIPNDKLGSPLKLWLKGKTKGLFDLTLDVEGGDDRFQPDPPVTEKMGVVELLMVPHEPDQSALDALEVDPDTDPVSQYADDLRDKALPDQKELNDEGKIKVGRMLHVQSGGHFGRAKLLLKKLDAAQWPAGTDDYKLALRASKSADGADSSALKIFDAEFDGTELSPAELTVSDLKAAEKTLWVEGSEASKKRLDVRLGLGLDRAPGGLDKEPKKNGDWAQFTVIQIKEVKLDYTAPSGKPNAWDDGASKFSINLKADSDGRKIKIKATLSENLKDVNVRFMLAPNKDNLKAANWGIDLPTTWTWKDVKPAVKHQDKADRKKVLHQSAMTDTNGVATSEVILSRFGGDKFRPGCYLDCDPHLAKYIDGHTDLEKRKPVQADKDIIVWRKFWYETVKVEGITVPAFAGANGKMTDVKFDMEQAPDIDITKATVQTYNPQAIYPKYMIQVNGGNGDALVVSENNKSQFFTSCTPDAERPIKIPTLICDAQWDPDGDSLALNAEWPASAFPIDIDTGKEILNPPLQGGDLYVSGEWIAGEWDPTLNSGAGGWVNVRNGQLANSDLSVNPARGSIMEVQVLLPAGVGPTTAQTRVSIVDLIVQAADDFLGEYSRTTKKILLANDPTGPADFQNILTHELGHAFKQVPPPNTHQGIGLPDHPHWYSLRGSHCSYDTNKCMMYDSQPIPGALNRFCDVCISYILVTNTSSLA